MKDLISKLTKLEATAPKPKKMLTEDSTSPMITEPKSRSLKDVFSELSENIAPGTKPLAIMDPTKKQAGMGVLSSPNQAVQNILKNLDPKDVQVVMTQQQLGQTPQQNQQQQTTAAGQPNPNQLQTGQQAVQEKDEGKPGKNFAKIAKSAGKRYGSKEAGERVAGAARAKLAAQGKLEEESEADKTAKDTKKAFPNVKHLTKSGNPDWKKHGFKDMPVKEGAKVDRMVKHIAKSERKLGKSKDEAEDIAWATANKRGYLDNKNKKKVKEADIPSSQGVDTRGAGLGAGRSPTTLEGKTMSKKAKPDFLDMDKDGNKKESMKKAVADKKKKTVKEGMSHRISAARLEGRSDGLRGSKNRFRDYEDLEEARAYHEGYKDGLDECYGQGVYENAPPATVDGMADQALEGNAFTAALAKTPKGGKFSVGGKTFTDRTGYDSKLGETDYAFEAWDRELSNLLNEGLSVSVSKGNENSEDSVNINATGPESEQLLQIVKSAGLGLFGSEEGPEAHPSSAMSIQPSHGEPDEVGSGGAEIDVVDDSDGMLALMKKLGGVEASGHSDSYSDEEDEEETCNECGGMMEAGHSCGSSKEMVDEVESEDQQEFEVAEDNAPDSGAEDSVADEDAEAKEDAALAGADSGDEEEMNESFASLLDRLTRLAEGSGDEPKHPEHDKKDDKDFDDAKEEDVTESTEEDEEEDVTEDLNEWANQVGKGPGKGTDASFERDIEFMTKVIAGGLNKPKSTGQTTVPVIAGQDDRMHDNPNDWATLAGIKKS